MNINIALALKNIYQILSQKQNNRSSKTTNFKVSSVVIQYMSPAVRFQNFSLIDVVSGKSGLFQRQAQSIKHLHIFCKTIKRSISSITKIWPVGWKSHGGTHLLSKTLTQSITDLRYVG